MSNQHKIFISIAEILIEVKNLNSINRLEIGDRMSSFLYKMENPIAKVSLICKESDDLSIKGELIYNPGLIWKMYRNDKEFCAVIRYPSINTRVKEQAILQANNTWDNITLTENLSDVNWQSLINTGAGELILRAKIILTDGLVFHASGIDNSGKGIVFVGHSGAGKSTQADIWSQFSNVTVMNDDRIAVRVKDNNAICYGTPWGGTANIVNNHRAQLSALILLEQALENKIKYLPPSNATALLLARTFLPYWDRTLMERALRNMNKLLKCVPVYLLQCRPGPEVIPLVRSVL